MLAAGAYVVHPRGKSGAGERGDSAWVAAVVVEGHRQRGSAIIRGEAGAPYAPGLLALRDGRLVADALRSLPLAPEVVLIDATGRDHPRRAGLALHLGAALDIPTVGVTDRPLQARAAAAGARRGDSAPLLLGDRLVGFAVRTRPGVKPVFAHAAWRTTPESAREVVMRLTGRRRTPEPIRLARQLARMARTHDGG
jgi:deoxyribonuclease V